MQCTLKSKTFQEKEEKREERERKGDVQNAVERVKSKCSIGQGAALGVKESILRRGDFTTRR